MNESDNPTETMTDGTESSIDREILHSRIRTEERGQETLPVAEAEISRVCEQLGLSDGVETVAGAIYRRSLQTDIIQNRTVGQVAAASVYAACRIEGDAISLREILREATGGHRTVSRTFSEISRELELNAGPTDPTDFVPRFCSELDLSEAVVNSSTEIIEKTMDSGLHSGQSPSAFAAGAVYAASLLCNEKRTQREVANVTGVSEKTIRFQYQRQIKHMGIV